MQAERVSFDRRAFLGALVAPAVLPFTRRTAQASAGAGGSCSLTPEQEEGPFYLPAEHVRSAIAEGKDGVALTVRLRLLDGASCAPIEGAAIDIWQCDAMGVYAGYSETAGMPGAPPGNGAPPPGNGGPPPGMPPGDGRLGPPHAKPANALTFLRGTQITDRDGFVRFLTIFPGFYAGRVNHIHLKVHAGHSTPAHVVTRTVHTGQLFFPEALASEISKRDPYARHRIERTTLDDDVVFTRQHGTAAIADVQRSADDPEAYVASLTVSIERALNASS